MPDFIITKIIGKRKIERVPKVVSGTKKHRRGAKDRTHRTRALVVALAPELVWDWPSTVTVVHP